MARNEIARFEPSNFAELHTFAKLVARSTMVPKQYVDKPDDVLVAFQMGAELGLRPLQALQNIAVINGRPAVWGDAMLALVLSHPDCIDVEEDFNAETFTATCTVKRRGRKPVIREFSEADAKRAKLWGKQGPWQEYPKRMAAMRARSWALRDCFADALRGISSVEEATDGHELDITERAEVLQQPKESRSSAAARALAPPEGDVIEPGKAHEAPTFIRPKPPEPEPVEQVDEGTGEITPAPAGERQTAPDKPAKPLTSPEELKSAFGRIDQAADVDAVNEILDKSQRDFTTDARREVRKRAAQRIGELVGKP